MNENSKQAPPLQVLDSGGRYSASFVQMDDSVVRFSQVLPNSPVPSSMDNLNRLTPGQAQTQCWAPYPYDPSSRSMTGYEHYRAYPGFTGQFAEPADQFSGNHGGFPMRYQEVSSKPDSLMTNSHLLCLDDGLGYPMPETRAASLPPFSSITTQSLPPRPQSAVKEDLRGYDEGLGARLSSGNNTPSHNEFGEGLTARLLERGMSLPSREENYTPPVQYRPWEVNPGPIRVSSRSQSETSQTPPSSGYPSEKRDDDNQGGGGGDSRSAWYRGNKSSEPNLISLDKPNDLNSGNQKGGNGGNHANSMSVPTTTMENPTVETSGGSTYSTLTKVPPQFPPHPRDDPAEMNRLPFPNSFGYFPPPPWDYRNEIPLKGLAPGESGVGGTMEPKYPLVPPPPARPGELQNMSHQFIDDRQMRGGGNGGTRHHHVAGPYCQNGNDGYKSFPPMTDGQSPVMQHTPPNAHNFSGSGVMHGLKSELEPGLKGGDKHASHLINSAGQPSSKDSSGSGGRGTKNVAAPGDDPNEKKPKKQKRKRCGECLGCQRKDNCGECAPCRNDKSHQICKMRRCEKLIERKVSGSLSSGGVEPVGAKMECPDPSREPSWW